MRGRHYLALELLDGRDLQDVLEEARGGLPLEQAVPILRDILQGLEHAHRKGVYHRDLKPENIRILADGRAKLMDFGIAKVRSLTRDLTLELDNAAKRIGTPPYMAPEQWEGEEDEHGKVDGRTDIYAFGIVLFEVLTGERLFHGSVKELCTQHLFGEPPPMDTAGQALPPGLDAVYRRCLAKKKEDRFQTAGKVEAALLKACAVSQPSSEEATQRTPAPESPSLRPPAADGSTRLLDPGAGQPVTVALAAIVPTPSGRLPRAGTRPRQPIPTREMPVTRILTAGRVRAPASDVPRERWLLRYAQGGQERTLHVHIGLAARLGRQRRPRASGGQTWDDVPEFVLRYLPHDDPDMRGLTDLTISRVHLAIAITPTGATVTDLSSGGTHLESTRLGTGMAAPLYHAASLRIGAGSLRLEGLLTRDPACFAPTAVLLRRAGNHPAHGYLLLAARAPVGSAAETGLKLDAHPGVLPLHAWLLPLVSDRGLEEGVALTPVGEAPVLVGGAPVPPGHFVCLQHGCEITLGQATIRVETHHPASDDALR